MSSELYAAKNSVVVVEKAVEGAQTSNSRRRNSGARRNRRRRNVAAAPVSTVSQAGMGPVNPGGKSFQVSDPPTISASSNAWLCTLFNPAHARDYGCTGLPDENRNPTNVITGLVNLNIGSDVPISDWNKGDDIWASVGEAEPIRLSTTASRTSLSFSSITRVDVFLIPSNDGIVHIIGEGTVIPVGETTSTPVTGAYLAFPVISDANNLGQNTRALSASLTMTNTSSWSSIGGYYLGGNMPFAYESESDGVPDVAVNISQIDNYVTYQGESAKGAYIICRPRSIDGISRWSSYDLMGWRVYENDSLGWQNLTGTSSDQGLSGLWSIHPAWDVSFVSYVPSGANPWRQKISVYYNLETERPYNAGGMDGALFDLTTLNYAMGLCDQVTYCYPAEYNDMGLLLPVLKRAARWGVKAITASMGLPPNLTSSVLALTDSLLQERTSSGRPKKSLYTLRNRM